MTVVLDIPTGRRKREIVVLARAFGGVSSAEFDLTPEELAEHLLMLDVMMAEPPWDQARYLPGDPSLGEDRSNLANADIPAVYMELGKRIALSFGNALTPKNDAQAARSFAGFCGRYNIPPTQPWARGTPKGQGNPWWGWGPYLPSETV